MTRFSRTLNVLFAHSSHSMCSPKSRMATPVPSKMPLLAPVPKALPTRQGLTVELRLRIFGFVRAHSSLILFSRANRSSYASLMTYTTPRLFVTDGVTTSFFRELWVHRLVTIQPSRLLATPTAFQRELPTNDTLSRIKRIDCSHFDSTQPPTQHLNIFLASLVTASARLEEFRSTSVTTVQTLLRLIRGHPNLDSLDLQTVFDDSQFQYHSLMSWTGPG
jgi:hypothetical protein